MSNRVAIIAEQILLLISAFHYGAWAGAQGVGPWAQLAIEYHPLIVANAFTFTFVFLGIYVFVNLLSR